MCLLHTQNGVMMIGLLCCPITDGLFICFNGKEKILYRAIKKIVFILLFILKN